MTTTRPRRSAAPTAPAGGTVEPGPVLRVDDLVAGYLGIPVVHGLQLHVDAGEVVALLGPNGAGKTTTLLTISGLLKPLGGAITVIGHRTARTRPHHIARLGLAHVPENRSLFFSLTVAENLGLALKGSRADRAEHQTRALDMFPALKPLLSRRAGLLSGGEQQMLAMARALVTSPRLLLVDEMSLGLAPVIVEQLLPTVRRVADETGAGVLMVEQHVHLALEIADRAYVLDRGRVTMSGPAGELARDRELMTASYLGDMAGDTA
jgi:branched-chain amino acid transport system ATP-binding protein